MNLYKTLLLISLSLLLACSDDSEPAPPPPAGCQPLGFDSGSLVILPLGDSRVEGSTPLYESYRFELWNLLVDGGAVEAGRHEGRGARQDDGDYPDFQNICFDTDHQGTGGATTSDIINTLSSVGFGRTPEVVLLGIGGNDLLSFDLDVSEVLNNIETIIEDLRIINSDIIVFVEQIAPAQSIIMTAENTQRFEEFNLGIMNLATDLTTAQSAIIAVDMATGWNDSFLADIVHYNQAGAARVAEQYFQAIEDNID